MLKIPHGGLAGGIAVALIAYATSLSVAALSVARAQPETQAQSETTHGSISTKTVTTFRADQTVEDVETLRIRILNESSLSSAGQQRLSFIDGVQKLHIVEAYTEKPDGRRVSVPDSGIITRDAEAGGNVYTRDQKQIVVIFPDLAVGDTVVLTWRLTRSGDMFPGHYSQAHIFPRQMSLGTSEVRIVAPKERYLNIATQGAGFETDAKEVDGARVYMEDGWGLVRASSNTPTLVLRFEAKTQEGLEKIQGVFRKKLEKFPDVDKHWDSSGH